MDAMPKIRVIVKRIDRNNAQRVAVCVNRQTHYPTSHDSQGRRHPYPCPGQGCPGRDLEAYDSTIFRDCPYAPEFTVTLPPDCSLVHVSGIDWRTGLTGRVNKLYPDPNGYSIHGGKVTVSVMAVMDGHLMWPGRRIVIPDVGRQVKRYERDRFRLRVETYDLERRSDARTIARLASQQPGLAPEYFSAQLLSVIVGLERRRKELYDVQTRTPDIERSLDGVQLRLVRAVRALAKQVRENIQAKREAEAAATRGESDALAAGTEAELGLIDGILDAEEL